MDGSHRMNRLVEEVRATLIEGKRVVICGWNARYNTGFDRELPKDKVIFFLQDNAILPPHNMGIMICTKHIGHADVARAEKHGPKDHKYHTHAGLSVGMIRMILTSCEDLLFQRKTRTKGETTMTPKQPPVPKTPDSKVESEETEEVVETAVQQKGTTSRSTKEEITFARAFFEKYTEDDVVPRFEISKLIRKAYGADSDKKPSWLARRGLLEGAKKSMHSKSRVSLYKAGLRLIEIHTTPSETAEVSRSTAPNETAVSKLKGEVDPVTRIRALMSTKPDLVAEQERLQSQLAVVEEKLRKITEAEELFDQLQKLVD